MNLFAATYDHVFRSTNKSTLWTIAGTQAGLQINALAVNANAPGGPTGFAASAGVGLFRSTNKGIGTILQLVSQIRAFLHFL